LSKRTRSEALTEGSLAERALTKTASWAKQPLTKRALPRALADIGLSMLAPEALVEIPLANTTSAGLSKTSALSNTCALA